jgi:DNA-binding CsgD family transcriptional regulator
MTGFTLNARQTSLLADIVDACAVVDPDVPLPWEAMRKIADLLGADSLMFGGYDTMLPHLWFGQQTVDPWGQQELTEPESPVEARDNPFWQTYWEGFCSHPDRSGDFDTVTTLADFINLADVHANADGVEREYERHISLYIRGRTPGRHLRLIGWRERGSNFTDRDRFFLRLLRPHLGNAFQSGSLARQEPAALTRRQLEVMTMVQVGMTNRQIARRVGLSEGTVRTHLENIYARLDVSSRTAAVHRVFGVGDNWGA